MFNIVGHSGCLLELLESGSGSAVVRKSTRDAEYMPRLMAQARKQKEYAALALPPGIDVPLVFDAVLREDIAYFDMEYIASADYITFLMNADVKSVREVSERLCDVIDARVEASTPGAFPYDAFQQKYEHIRSRMEAGGPVDARVSLLAKKAESLFARMPRDEMLPLGPCHGDLTLSNVLISHDARRITLLDLLDNFVESPLQDMVKLRQDTRFLWSLPFYTRPFDTVRAMMTLQAIDRWMEARFRRYDFYHAYYRPFQVMNFLRILPYAKHEAVVSRVCDALETLLED